MRRSQVCKGLEEDLSEQVRVSAKAPEQEEAWDSLCTFALGNHARDFR